MTDYSLNKQFEDLVQKTLQEQQSDQNNKNKNQEIKQNNNNNSVSGESPDFFQGNNAIKKRKRKFKSVIERPE